MVFCDIACAGYAAADTARAPRHIACYLRHAGCRSHYLLPAGARRFALLGDLPRWIRWRRAAGPQAYLSAHQNETISIAHAFHRGLVLERVGMRRDG